MPQRIPAATRHASRILVLSLAASIVVCSPGVGLAQWGPEGSPLCKAPKEQSFPTIVPDGSGGAIVAWSDFRGGSLAIYAQHTLASGIVDPAWPVDGRAICTGVDFVYTPALIPDGAGGAILAWSYYQNGRNVYAQHILASGALDPAWPANGRALCTAAGEQYAPAVAPDGSGGAIVTWLDCRDSTSDYCFGGPGQDIYAQHVLASGVVDPLWPSDGRAICTAPNAQTDLKIVADGSGGAIVTWSDERGGLPFDSDVYAQHILAAGVVDPAWPADGRTLSSAAGRQGHTTSVTDGLGGAIVVWIDHRSTVADIYAQRILATGAVDPAWPLDGSRLCEGPANGKSAAAMVSDDAGGAIVTWQDPRNGNLDIYAQHVLSTGAADPAWPEEGRALCTAPGHQEAPRIVPDGAGGAIVAWQDARGGPYAQHVMASGAMNPYWPLDGRALCPIAELYSSVQITSDGAGGAIVAWQDLRDATEDEYWEHDIYAQRVYGSGEVAAIPSEARLAPVSLGAPHPNPSREGRMVIDFELPNAQRVEVEIFDVAGHRVRRLVEGREFEAGAHALPWECRNDAGASVPTGIYLVRMRTVTGAATRKIAVLD